MKDRNHVTNEELVIRIKAGIDTGMNMLQLYEQTRLFICGIAKRYKGLAEFDDLQQEGYLALYDAIDGFQPEKGYKFLTYAGYWIAQRIQRYITAQKLPDGGLLSLDIRTIAEDDGEVLINTLRAEVDVEEDVVEDVNLHELKAVLWPLVDALPDNQGEVLRMRYQENKTRKVTAECLGIGEKQARALEEKGLRELRCARLRAFLPEVEEIYSMGIVGNGARRFNTTWTSSTERAAMRYIKE